MMRRSAREDPGDTSEPAARGAAAESPARDSAGSRERGSVESPERGSDRSREQGSAGPRAQGSEPYGWAALASAGVFLLYVVTLAPTTAFWDTSEYIATAHILGIPHPPGNPLFVVLARAWEALLAPLGLSVAVRVNLFSAFVSAAAHGLWFLVAFRILTFFSEDRRFALIGSAAAVLVSATAFTVWNQSNVNEKVYTVSLLTVALLSWLAFHWRGNLGRGKDDNLLVLMVFILALSVGNHLMAFLAAPALAVFILRVHPQTLINYRLYLAAGLAGLAGLSIHLFLPLRAALDPIISEADPTCETLGAALTSIVTWGQAGCAELSAALGRQQYDKPALVPRLAPLWSQIVNYLQYFDWQWSRSLSGDEVLFSRARGPFTVLFSGLGLFGAIEHFRRDRKSFWYVFMLFATLSAGLLFYLNFKYGYSIPAPIANRDLHEVRERDYFFIVGFSVWGLWAGIGIAAAWIWLAERFRVGLVRVAPVLGLALLPLALNWSWATRAHDYSARDWAYNLLQSIEPYGILFTNGDNDTFPLWYLQEVEGIRRDVDRDGDVVPEHRLVYQADPRPHETVPVGRRSRGNALTNRLPASVRSPGPARGLYSRAGRSARGRPGFDRALGSGVGPTPVDLRSARRDDRDRRAQPLRAARGPLVQTRQRDGGDRRRGDLPPLAAVCVVRHQFGYRGAPCLLRINDERAGFAGAGGLLGEGGARVSALQWRPRDRGYGRGSAATAITARARAWELPRPAKDSHPRQRRVRAPRRDPA